MVEMLSEKLKLNYEIFEYIERYKHSWLQNRKPNLIISSNKKL